MTECLTMWEVINGTVAHCGRLDGGVQGFSNGHSQFVIVNEKHNSLFLNWIFFQRHTYNGTTASFGLSCRHKTMNKECQEWPERLKNVVSSD